MYSRRYRNRRLGDFLKELDLTEGRFTGIPTIQAKLEENGSPRARFITDDTRSYLDVFIPVHKTVKSSDIAIKTFDEVENGPNNEPNQGSFDPNSDPNGPNPDPNKLSKRQNTILKTIQLHPEFSRKAIAELTGMSDSTVKREIRFLKESGFIRRDGLTKGGKWIVIREIPMNE